MTEDDSGNRIESVVIATAFCAASVALLAMIGTATRAGQTDADWWTRPALAPGVFLAVLVVANLVTVWGALADLRRTPPTAAERAEARVLILGWLRPLEFVAYFLAYLWLIPHAGYFPATLAFVLFLLWRSGLRSPGWMLAGVCSALALVGIFRIGLGVWMPAPDVYDLFPEGMRMTLIRWF
jgi:hypothetical protein